MYMAFAPKESHNGTKDGPFDRRWIFMKSGTMLMVGGISSDSMTSFFTSPWPLGFRMPRPYPTIPLNTMAHSTLPVTERSELR